MVFVYSTNINFWVNANNIITIIVCHGDNTIINKHLKVHIYPNSVDYILYKIIRI